MSQRRSWEFQKIEENRALIANVLFVIDFITLQENPQLVADYAIKIGCL